MEALWTATPVAGSSLSMFISRRERGRLTDLPATERSTVNRPKTEISNKTRGMTGVRACRTVAANPFDVPIRPILRQRCGLSDEFCNKQSLEVGRR